MSRNAFLKWHEQYCVYRMKLKSAVKYWKYFKMETRLIIEARDRMERSWEHLLMSHLWIEGRSSLCNHNVDLKNIFIVRRVWKRCFLAILVIDLNIKKTILIARDINSGNLSYYEVIINIKMHLISVLLLKFCLAHDVIASLVLKTVLYIQKWISGRQRPGDHRIWTSSYTFCLRSG